MVSGPVSGSVEVGTGGQEGDKTKPKREVGDGGPGGGSDGGWEGRLKRSWGKGALRVSVCPAVREQMKRKWLDRTRRSQCNEGYQSLQWGSLGDVGVRGWVDGGPYAGWWVGVPCVYVGGCDMCGLRMR